MKRKAMICIQSQNVSSVALFKYFTVNWPWSFKGRERSHNHIYYICLISNTGTQGLQKKHTLLLSSSIVESGRFSYNSKGFEIFFLGDICCCLNVMIIGISCWKLSQSNKMLAALEDVQLRFELLILAWQRAHSNNANTLMFIMGTVSCPNWRQTQCTDEVYGNIKWNMFHGNPSYTC